MIAWKKRWLKKTANQNGQALLVVTLVMVVALTVGLALVSRSITNQRITTEEDNSQRAFSAAEAGVEQALKSGANIASPVNLGNTAAIRNVVVTSVNGTEIVLRGGSFIDKDEGVEVWLAPYPTLSPAWGGKFLTIYWGSQSDVCKADDLASANGGNSMAALEIVIMTGTKVNPTTSRYPIDPCNGAFGSRQTGNSFDTADAVGNFTVNGVPGFRYRKTISIGANTGLIAALIPLYADTPIAIKGCNGGGNNCTALPNQGSKIDSVGTSGGSADANATISRKLTVFQGFPSIPSELLHYILFTTHN